MQRTALLVSVVAAAGCALTRHRGTDRDLATYIDTLTAIDSHAHPMAYVSAGAPADTDYDALPLDGIPPFDLPLPLRPNNPAYREAQRALFGVSGGDSGSAQARLFAHARARRARNGTLLFPE